MCWWKNSFASYSAAGFVDGEARLVDVIFFSQWFYKVLARFLLTTGRYLWKCLWAKIYFVIDNLCLKSTKFVSCTLDYFCILHWNIILTVKDEACYESYHFTFPWIKQNTSFFSPLFLGSCLLKVEHGSIFLFFSHIQKLSSCSVRSANKLQWGRGIYFANISIKWSVKVRLGRRQGMREKRGSCLAVGREL